MNDMQLYGASLVRARAGSDPMTFRKQIPAPRMRVSHSQTFDRQWLTSPKNIGLWNGRFVSRYSMTSIWHASPRTRTRSIMLAFSSSVNSPSGDLALIVCKAGSECGSRERERKNDMRAGKNARMESLNTLGNERCHLAGFASLEHE
jgi:hypothetical protein